MWTFTHPALSFSAYDKTGTVAMRGPSERTVGRALALHVETWIRSLASHIIGSPSPTKIDP